jgi:uncharacterized membrane protein
MRRNKTDNGMVKWEGVSFIPSHLTIALSVLFLLTWPFHCRFYSFSFDHCIVSFIPSHLTIALSVLFHLIWPFHCQFYSFSFDHSIVDFIPSHLTIPLSVLFLLIWPFHFVGFIPSHLTKKKKKKTDKGSVKWKEIKSKMEWSKEKE